MQRFPFQSWLNYNPLLPASDKWSTPLNSPHHDDFKKVWFVGCLTTARATPASREGGKCPNDNSEVIINLLDDILGIIGLRILYISIL